MTAPVSRAGIQDRLRDIQSVTDAALSRLDDHDLLAELLERTRDILQADTAAVLLLDFSSGELIATAAAGLEEEVRQGVRGGKVIGVFHIGSLTPREFTGDDVEFLQLAADRAATAVHSLMMQEDRVAAAALQRSLLPSALPAAAGAQMAARYVPGAGAVGGDWYDVFTLPSGQLCIVTGDVTGSGLPAAVIMGRMRSALRAYALESDDPATVLARLDRKMQYFEPGALATVLYAVFDPGVGQMHICSAGHYPPVIAHPGRPAELADIPPGLLIGAVPGAQRHVATIEISPGTLVCFYTDGLVERRGQTIDHGLARLCQAVTAQPPDTACAMVMAALVGREPVPDDIALLMFRRLPSGTR